jgi:hypothetical protein
MELNRSGIYFVSLVVILSAFVVETSTVGRVGIVLAAFTLMAIAQRGHRRVKALTAAAFAWVALAGGTTLAADGTLSLRLPPAAVEPLIAIGVGLSVLLGVLTMLGIGPFATRTSRGGVG